jgi:hypothetical protein
MKLSVRRKWTFRQRFSRELVFFGIPLVLLEFIGIPRSSWVSVLAFAIPTTIVGLFFYSILEHFVIAYLAAKQSRE